MKRRLADLSSGDWRPQRPLKPEQLDRVRALAADLLAQGSPPHRRATVVFVPGRIEVLGKHTDYGGGRSLVAATEQGFWIVACGRRDSIIRVQDRRRGQVEEFSFDSDSGGGRQAWGLYPRAVAQRMFQATPGNLTGADIAMESDLPAASGLSSSSALIVGAHMALARCNELERDPRWARELPAREDLAGYLGAVENGRSFAAFGAGQGVGTRGGDQDHTAILCSEAGEIRQFRYLPTVCERVLVMPSGIVFAVAVSGVRAAKTGAAMRNYNRTSDLVARLEKLWDGDEGPSPVTLGSIVRSVPGGTERLDSILARSVADDGQLRELRQRLMQFRRETEEIVPTAGDAIAAGDLEGFGRCVDLSMTMATEILGNQTAETIGLTAAARDLGAVAASAFGAGFGGAVWAWVPREGVEGFLERWEAAYRADFPERQSASLFLWTNAGGSATEL